MASTDLANSLNRHAFGSLPKKKLFQVLRFLNNNPKAL